jgi:hypothetical protein
MIRIVIALIRLLAVPVTHSGTVIRFRSRRVQRPAGHFSGRDHRRSVSGLTIPVHPTKMLDDAGGDVDNYAKCMLDVMQGTSVYSDDKRVVLLTFCGS